MNQNRITTTRSIPHSRLRRGMTFIEVMFAVVILGVGFIMIAAVFPVAIQQTQSNIDETTAAALARSAVNTLMMTNLRSYNLPNGPLQYPINSTPTAGSPPYALSLRDGDPADPIITNPPSPPRPALWYAVRGNIISVADPRYAWAAFYVWPQNVGYARVVVVVTRCRNRPIYDQFHDTNRWTSGAMADGVTSAGVNISSTPATLEGQNIPVNIASYPDPAIPNQFIYYITDTTPDAHGDSRDAIASMAYIVIQNDTANNGLTNGYVFRIGNYDNNAAHQGWQLLPGNDMTGLINVGNSSQQITTITGTAYIVGRGYADPMNPQNGFDGPAQEVAAYTTFIPMY